MHAIRIGVLRGSGVPTLSRRTLASVLLTFARSEVSALSPSGLRWPPTPARGRGHPLAEFWRRRSPPGVTVLYE